jgi:hypothetical protein
MGQATTDLCGPQMGGEGAAPSGEHWGAVVPKKEIAINPCDELASSLSEVEN